MVENRAVVEKIHLAGDFPRLCYTPHGYLDNPYHSAVLNRSGVIRSVPPLGFGYWCRRFPWPYGEGILRRVNYLSFLLLGARVGDVLLAAAEDFRARGVTLCSLYHTKNMMSYDWEAAGVAFSASYFLAEEHALVCILDMRNTGPREAEVIVYATNHYGYPETRWWGGDGIAANYHPHSDTMISKIYAGGDIFVTGGNHPSGSHFATTSEEAWMRWMQEDSPAQVDHLDMQFPGAVYAGLSYHINIPAGGANRLTLCLARGANQAETLQTCSRALGSAIPTLNRKLAEDQAFYEGAPLLTGDWPETWKQGWIYDYETLRMTIRPPLGIYRHPWDGMQIFAPRQVLGETMLDTLCLSYAAPEFAKEVIYGTFAGTPAPNVPCTREDGSMNMIGASGNECGTAPIWGLPFYTIRAIYLRDRDDAWIRKLYPYLQAFVEWWLENRTDADGWFHCDNSWESGQDGSRRFTFAGGDEAASAAFVRTVDIEASMADALQTMAFFAGLLGQEGERARWQSLAGERIHRTRAMYVDGWFRDFDARTGQPILLEDYLDVMMLVPVAVGIATPEQIEGVKPKFQTFRQNPTHWLEWPSFMYPFTEAAWRAGLGEFTASLLAETGHRIYTRTAGIDLKPMGRRSTGLPEAYNYRVPGVQGEFWPVELSEDLRNGCECYGWGATFPSLAIRNLIGFRESEDPQEMAFILAPTIPANLLPGERIEGKHFGIRNLHFAKASLEVDCAPLDGGDLELLLACQAERPLEVQVRDGDGKLITSMPVKSQAALRWRGPNGQRYRVVFR